MLCRKLHRLDAHFYLALEIFPVRVPIVSKSALSLTFFLCLSSQLILSGCNGSPVDDASTEEAQTAPSQADGHSSSSKFGPLQELKPGEAPEPAIAGTWQSLGYGWYFVIDADGVAQYQHAGDLCFKPDEDTAGSTETLSLDYRFYRTGPNPNEAILQLLPDDTEIRVQRLDALPESCSQPLNGSYAETFEYFAALMSAEYAFFEERKIHWSARVVEAWTRLPEVQTDEEFFQFLASCLENFSDSHTKLMARIDGEKKKVQDGQGVTLPALRAEGREMQWLVGIFQQLQTQVLDPGSRHVANDRILWGTLQGGKVGYLTVFTMGGFSGVDIGDPAFREAEFEVFDQVMDEALTAMKDAEAVILDLSNNRGGYDAISRRLAGRFAAEPFDAYSTRTPSSGLPARMRTIEPAQGVRYTGPVFLLTSDVTVSGGELATLALRQLPNVRHVGRTTRGSFSTVLSKPLPNGWILELSNEIFASPDGQVHEEIGLIPETDIEVFPLSDPIAGHADALTAILDLLESKDAA